jgi:hypothetical protein
MSKVFHVHLEIFRWLTGFLYYDKISKSHSVCTLSEVVACGEPFSYTELYVAAVMRGNR